MKQLESWLERSICLETCRMILHQHELRSYQCRMFIFDMCQVVGTSSFGVMWYVICACGGQSLFLFSGSISSNQF